METKNEEQVTKSQFIQAAKTLARRSPEAAAMETQVVAENRVAAQTFRAFDPALADLVDSIADNQEKVAAGFQELSAYVADKLEK